MLAEILAEKDYLPILKMADGSEVTRENWEARRREMLSLLEEYSYGKTPKDAVTVTAECVEVGMYFCAGKCREELMRLTYKTARGEGSFPFQIYTPTGVEHPPIFLHIAFGLAPHRYIPVEEIIDAGYALVVVNYRDMVNDNHHGDYSGGIAAHFGTTVDREKDEWGKIGMWAWGASRVVDYLFASRRDLDVSRIAVIGHSRLGKTALWCGAQDERIAAVISNNSGYGGASSSKHCKGENISYFLAGGSWDWFCERFKDYEGEGEDNKPYDQAFLLSLIAPRPLLVGSAENDFYADPEGEFLTTLHASPAWELLGETGLVTEDVLPKDDVYLGEGNVLYHRRRGEHYLSRHDWAAYIRFLDSKWNKK